MKENKSIDGLTTRGAKKSTVKSSNAAKTAAKSTKSHTASTPTTPTPKPKSSRKKTIISTETLTDPESSITTSSTTDITETNQSSSEQTIDDFLSPISAFDFDGDTKELTVSANTKTPKQQSNPMKNDEDTPFTDSAKPKKSKKKPGKVRKTITIILLILILAVISIVTWAIFWGNDIIAKITGGQGNILDLFTFVTETYEPLKTDSNGRTNILAFGTSGFSMEGEGFDGVHDGASLTDSIMIISLNQDTGDVAMLSLPRDLKVSRTCTATGKINEIYWCNNMNDDNEQAGAEALMAEVSDILNLDFQYYAHLNWGSLVSVVDILGGIKITLDEDIYDYGWTGATYEAGVEYTINGEEALGLARARHGTIGGDFSRGASQQKILIGIKNRIFEKQLSITDMLSLASTLGDNLRTNFSISDMKTLAHLTQIYDFDSMRQISLANYDTNTFYVTTGYINNISYVLPSAGAGNYWEIQEFVASQLSSDPRSYESPSILILNASDVAGAAAAEQSKLLTEGYPYVDTDNAPEGDYLTGTTLYAINPDKAGTKQLLETYYWTDAHSAAELPDNISRDYDFIIIVNPASED